MLVPKPNGKIALKNCKIVLNTLIDYIANLAKISFEEIGGYIVFREELYPIMAIYLRGYVEGVPCLDYARLYKTMECILQKYFENGVYVALPFHTHTYETARRYGKYLLENPSEGDFRALKRLERFSHAILITPEYFILYTEEGIEKKIKVEAKGELVIRSFRLIPQKLVSQSYRIFLLELFYPLPASTP